MDNDKWIVICGDPVDGFHYYGPFETREEAMGWVHNLKEPWCIAPLTGVEGAA